MDFPDVHTHLLHYLHAITEGENDSLLSGPQQVGTSVFVEVQPMEGASGLAVFKHTLSTIAEGQDGKAVAANAVMIGAVAAVKGFPLSKDLLRKTLAENVPQKFLDLNLRAFDLGYETMSAKN